MFLSSLLMSIGTLFAGASASACPAFFLEETKCPKSLLK